MRPIRPMKRVMSAMFTKAMTLNLEQIRAALRSVPDGASVLDLGCSDGVNTRGCCPPEAGVVGVELDEEAVRGARARGLSVVRADLTHRIPLADGSFDAVVSNQVIEHLSDTDTFAAECFRLLRPGGLLVVSTENLASWHNIAALLGGWQPFSLTNMSLRRARVGNPLSNPVGDAPNDRLGEHIRVMAFRALKELFEAHGFTGATVRGAGYYPLPAGVGRYDPRHAVFITVVARKPAP